MNIFAEIRDLIISTLDQMVAAGALPDGLNFAPITAEPPRDPAHGDMATNAAMVLAKPAGMKPRDIADALANKLSEDARITSADVAGPGFLNLRLAPVVWQGIAGTILTRHRFRTRVPGAGAKGQCRICIRQPHRAAARRPHAGGRIWRCAGILAGFCGL